MPRTVPPASPSYSFLLLKPTAPPTVYTLALHDALPIPAQPNVAIGFDLPMRPTEHILSANSTLRLEIRGDRKSTRLNSSHLVTSYAVFCLKKKHHRANTENHRNQQQGNGTPRLTPYQDG